MTGKKSRNQVVLEHKEYSSPHSDAIFLKGTYFYLGWITPHHGHFILESLSRIWPLIVSGMDFENIRFAFHIRDGRTQGITVEDLLDENNFVQTAYSRLGIDLSEVHVIDEPTIF